MKWDTFKLVYSFSWHRSYDFHYKKTPLELLVITVRQLLPQFTAHCLKHKIRSSTS